jgi:hypothetical protein
MKTYKNLYPRIWAYENLYEAWHNAARGKRKARGVAAFEYALTDRLLELEEELRTQTYRPGAYRHFRITSPKPPAHQRGALPGSRCTPRPDAANRTDF